MGQQEGRRLLFKSQIQGSDKAVDDCILLWFDSTSDNDDAIWISRILLQFDLIDTCLTRLL